LDSSGSLRREYHKEKNFLKAVASAFDISPEGSRAGVVTFSYKSEHSIKMSEHTDINSFKKAVDAIPLMGYTTRIDRALRLSQKELFAPKNGGRDDIRDVLILLTDGTQTIASGAENPATIMKEIRKSGVETVVIGIGRGTNPRELDHMAGGRGKAFIAGSFDELTGAEFVTKMIQETCNKVPSKDGIVNMDEVSRWRRELKEKFDKRALRNARLRNDAQLLDDSLVEEEPPTEQ